MFGPLDAGSLVSDHLTVAYNCTWVADFGFCKSVFWPRDHYAISETVACALADASAIAVPSAARSRQMGNRISLITPLVKFTL